MAAGKVGAGKAGAGACCRGASNIATEFTAEASSKARWTAAPTQICAAAAGGMNIYLLCLLSLLTCAAGAGGMNVYLLCLLTYCDEYLRGGALP